MSGMSLNSSTTSLSSSSTLVSRTPSEKSSLGAYQIIREGPAQVKEKESLMKSMFWQNKYLLLREYQLDFLKAKGSPKVSFSIRLADVTNITRSEDHPYSFEITNYPGAGGANSSPPRDGTSRVYICKVETDEDVYSWMDCIYQRCPSMGGVSNPTNFTHRVHVGFDPTSGSFVGLPVEWEKLLKGSAITEADYQKNPEAVVEVLQFYTEKLAKRAEDPRTYPSLTPTPSIESDARSKQLGYNMGGGGNTIAPPRQTPPAGYKRQDSYSQMRPNTGGTPPPSGRDEKLAMQQREEEDARRRAEDKYRREQEYRRRQDEERRNQDELNQYNASLPQSRIPLAKQELGGYGGDSRDASPSGGQQQRYNPQRPAPSTPQGAKVQPPSSATRQITAQRAAPPAPVQNGSNAYQKVLDPKQRVPVNGQQRTAPSGPKYIPATANGQSTSRNPTNQPSQSQQRQQPNAVKPLNVQPKQQPGPGAVSKSDAVKKAEQALTRKEEPSEKRKDVRMSSMSESEVMAKLREVVSKDKPLDSYNKQKKIGQGASGSVYVARIKESATSGIARQILKEQGSRAQVAIKQMDLRNQPRKELIVNEIIVMKDSKHPNIVNFLDAFLQEEQSELWVVMEFMEGGALTDVIDNNPSISEDQIATICLEVSIVFLAFQ